MGVPNAPFVICRISNGHISATGGRSTLCLVLGWDFRGRRIECAISGSIKSRMAAGRHLGKVQRHRAVSLRQHGFLVHAYLLYVCFTYLDYSWSTDYGVMINLFVVCHSDAHCCHTGTTIKHPVPDRVQPSFVIFDIRALWRSELSVRVPGWQKLQMTAVPSLAQDIL